jgi:hypothetical protein
MTEALLKSNYDSGVDVNAVSVFESTVTGHSAGDSYCLDQVVNGKQASATRGAGALADGKVTENTHC